MTEDNEQSCTGRKYTLHIYIYMHIYILFI